MSEDGEDETSASAAAPSVTRSARSLLVAWANQQDPWMRALTGEVLHSRRPLISERVSDFYARLLVEKDLESGDPEPTPPLELDVAPDDTEERLSLLQLDGVSNVNALTTGQSMTFNEGLTVGFGKNGAGKSGYVRVFKRLAAVRGAEPILPNVHAPPRHRSFRGLVSPTASVRRSTRSSGTARRAVLSL